MGIRIRAWIIVFCVMMLAALHAEQGPVGVEDPCETGRWAAMQLSTADWKPVAVPYRFDDSYDGIMWFRREVELPGSADGRSAVLDLGPLDDADQVWINGKPVGSMDIWNKDRHYSVPAKVLTPGKNVIAISVLDTGGGGGFFGTPEQLCLTIEGGGPVIPLAGTWLSKPCPSMPIDMFMQIQSDQGDPMKITASQQAPQNRLTLWYTKPARVWTEANPVGNGRLGAMVFGGVDEERLQLNEGTVWAGGPYDPNHDDALPALPQVRDLIFEGQYKEAEALIKEKLMSRPMGQMPYQLLGDLKLAFDHHGPASQYARTLDLETGILDIRYAREGVTYGREIFASAPDQCLVVRLTADQPGKLSFTAGLTSPQKITVMAEDPGVLVMDGISGDDRGVKGEVHFQCRVQVRHEGGTVRIEQGRVRVDRANTVTLIVAAATNYVSYQDLSADPEARVSKILQALGAKTYPNLRKAHVTDYQKLFSRVSLDIGETPEAKRPTDQRIRTFSNGKDPQLAELYFQFARYLLISCSRPGGQPATLQGLWNDQMRPPWGSKYTININTEMNYWMAEKANLSECHEPLFRMVEDLSVSGRRTAKRHYGAGGWVVHHNTDLWRATGPIDGPFWGMWPMGGAWLSTHVWTRYEYTRDLAFLKRMYPAIKGAAEFFLDALVKEPTHGWLVTCPSISPENTHPFGTSICAGPTMDQQIIRDLFDGVIRSSELLGTDAEFREQVRTARGQLAPMQVGKAGQLQEWLEDWDTQTPEQHHRHVSHLYGLFPSEQITRQGAPELFAAARETLRQRGDDGTGWSLAWKINFWARLEDGERSFKLLSMLLTPQRTYPNLFDAHPPFQIDGNFGGCSGMIEMLLQCRDGEIVLLPALPPAWPAGRVRGLRAKDGIEIDLEWSKGKLTRAVLRPGMKASVRVRYGDRAVDLAVRPQVQVTLGPSLKP